MDKIKVRKVTITRAEGLVRECGRPESYATLGEAGRRLAQWASTAPDTGGYDKCDFTVEWSDGETYTGRVDLQRSHRVGYDLVGHIRDFLRMLAGETRPAYVAASGEMARRWALLQAEREKDGTADAARAFLAKYAIEAR